jgi:hypothetical protein
MAADLPPLARWLPRDTPALQRRIVERALADVGILEMPPGSNRSGVIDEYNTRAGVPPGSFWCASAVGAWWKDAGSEVPPGYASCDAWLRWGEARGLLDPVPSPGAAVLYGRPGDASHIGVVVRVTPILLSVEGNTTLGGEFNRNGIAVDLKAVATARVLGYVRPLVLGGS